MGSDGILAGSICSRMPFIAFELDRLSVRIEPGSRQDLAVRVRRAAALARRWLSVENSSTSSRVIFHFSATRSALSP